MNLVIDKLVTPIESYEQQICEVGDKLIIGNEYKVWSWFPFYGNTMVILRNGSYVLKQQLKKI